MGINFNKNSFGALTASKLNNTKAAKNAGNIADTKAANAAKEGNSLNSATLKSNQGLKLDSDNLFNKTGDVVPAEPQEPQKTEESGKKKSWWQKFKERYKENTKLTTTVSDGPLGGLVDESNGGGGWGLIIGAIDAAIGATFGS